MPEPERSPRLHTQLWRIVGLWALWWAAFLGAAKALEAGTVLALHEAQARISVDGQASQLPQEAWQTVRLPYHWGRMHPGRSGSAAFELSFSFPDALPQEPYGLYFPAVGNTAEVWLNGKLLARYGDIRVPNQENYAKVPRYLAVPLAMLEKNNVLRVLVHADASRRGGLSEVWVGPAHAIENGEFARVHIWRTTGSLLLTMLCLITALIALTFWITQSHRGPDGRLQRDSVYLWAGIAELCWALRVSDALSVQPPLPWPFWGVAIQAAYAGWVCGVLLFCHHVAGWGPRPFTRWMRWITGLLFLTVVITAWWGIYGGQPSILTLGLGLMGWGAAIYACLYLVATIRRHNVPRLLIVGAGLLNVAAGLRDWVAFRMTDSFSLLSWNRYVSVLFALVLLYIIALRFRQASRQARELLGTLETRIAQREEELAGTYRQLEAVAREQARANERERILRDMHDGVGSHISAAIRQLGSGQANPKELLRNLRDSLDQLKLSIDSIHMPPGDVGALLAGLRYRLEPRLKTAGIRLEWAVEELACIERLDSQGMRQLQFLLFEAISNVLQHAHAATLRIEACMHLAAVRLRIIDDGCGFDATTQAPRMLHERARALGARLTISSTPSCTMVEVWFKDAAP